ncbi:MAG: magnesium/cobalt transporter CorA [Bacteroidales bacterium]|nr:magnesium/cobalt transporter CorA [Bacteroidales bacterium]
MVNVFYKENDRLKLHQGIEGLALIPKNSIIWIDLIQPSYDERIQVEELCDVALQTRQEIEEIEVSSRYSEEDDVIVNNSHFLIRYDGEFRREPVSFIIKNNVLISYRNAELRTFAEMYKRSEFTSKIHDAFHIFLTIIEIRIDLDADLIESIVKEIASLSSVVINNQLSEELLMQISKFQEETMLIRENIVDKQRVLSNILKSDIFPSELHNRVRIMLKDIGSLLDYTVFSFQRLDYLQSTILGLINVEQNKIIKIFTVATVIFMPPTLIASIYGMNFHFMPELEWKIGYPLSIFLMLLSATITLIIFRKKKWL